MRSVFVDEIGKTILRKIEIPSLRDEDILIKVRYAGICGSDVHIFTGHHEYRKPPVIPGHELSGEVVGIGGKVGRFAIGDRVTILPMISCGRCDLCLSGFENHCRNVVIPGTSTWTGAFVEYFRAPESVVFKIPEHIGYKAAILTEPLSIAIHALKKIPAINRKSLLILGAGTIGILSMIAAKKLGFEHVAITDIVDFNLKKAKELGADETLNVSVAPKPGPAHSIGPATYLSVLIAASAPNIFDQAFASASVGATIIYVSMIIEALTFSTRPIVSRELHIMGSRRCTRVDFQEALDMLSLDQERFDSVITHVFDMADCQRAFEMMTSRPEGHIKVLVKMGE